eukprot:8924697-Pyramimonas_sp.AAC.1
MHPLDFLAATSVGSLETGSVQTGVSQSARSCRILQGPSGSCRILRVGPGLGAGSCRILRDPALTR